MYLRTFRTGIEKAEYVATSLRLCEDEVRHEACTVHIRKDSHYHKKIPRGLTAGCCHITYKNKNTLTY